MEGMISRRMREIQRLYRIQSGAGVSLERWAQGVILKLLETTHGQWLYRNVQIHDAVAGALATVCKEALMQEIKEQREMGADGLLEEDQWLLEINLGDLEEGSGEQEQYWLVAIKAAWEAAIPKERQPKAQEAGPRAAGQICLMDNSTTNPCDSRVGRLSVAYRTGNHRFLRESSPLKWFQLQRCLVRALCK